jgi:hypothetical protein
MLAGSGRVGATSSIGPTCPGVPMNTPPPRASGKSRPVAAPKVVALGKKVAATAADVE